MREASTESDFVEWESLYYKRRRDGRDQRLRAFTANVALTLSLLMNLDCYDGTGVLARRLHVLNFC